MSKFLNKLKKPCFWPILGLFSQFWGKKIFSTDNQALSRTASYEILAPYQISEKIYDAIPRKCLCRMTDGRTEGQTDSISYDPSGYRQGSKNWLTWRHTDGHKNKEKNLKNQHCLLSMLVLQIEYLYNPLNVEGVTKTGSLLPAILKFIYAEANSLPHKNENHLKLLFSPLVSPSFWN